MPDKMLWPAYFDIDNSRADGRRVPTDLAVHEPTIDEIAQAVQQIGYDAVVDRQARYPREPWEAQGRVIVQGADEESKNDVVQGVAAYLQVIRD